MRDSFLQGSIIMPRILVTGANGQLGSELRVLAEHLSSDSGSLDFVFIDRGELDLTDAETVKKHFAENPFETIVNCAAYTAVDKAESEPELADAVNHRAVRMLAEIAKAQKIRLIHVSTDYVFDGTGCKPYVENDPTNPQGVYGKSKCDGEAAVLEINPENGIIIRTSWVYSSFGHNFVKTMLRLGKERKELGVIYDQVGTPTYARDLAGAILKIVQSPENENAESVAVYHFSNEGVCSWYDFAREIMRMTKLDCNVRPILTEQYPTPAKRPHFSVVNKAKIKEAFEIEIPYWKEGLDHCLRQLGERK